MHILITLNRLGLAQPEAVRAELARQGFRLTKFLPRLGFLTGVCDEGSVEKLRAVDGVESVARDTGTFESQMPRPDSFQRPLIKVGARM